MSISSSEEEGGSTPEYTSCEDVDMESVSEKGQSDRCAHSASLATLLYPKFPALMLLLIPLTSVTLNLPEAFDRLELLPYPSLAYSAWSSFGEDEDHVDGKFPNVRFDLA